MVEIDQSGRPAALIAGMQIEDSGARLGGTDAGSIIWLGVIGRCEDINRAWIER
jgi:hypothetical protein